MAETTWSWEGIQLVWVVLGLVGAALGIGSMPPMTYRQCWVALGSGIIFASYGPLWANHAFVHWVPSWINPAHDPLPSFMMGSIAFVCGVGGLFLVPTIISLYRDPRGFLGKAWIILRGLNRPDASPGEQRR